MQMKRKNNRRTGKVKRVPATATPPFRKWTVVMAELRAGTASVGIRFDEETTVHFFAMHKPPKEAVTMVVQIAKGEITLRDIAEMDWHAVDML